MKKALIASVFFLVGTLSGIAQQYEVSQLNKTFRDADRSNRRIRAEIYYPTNTENSQIAQGQFPVLILGHGFVMWSNAYQNFYDTLVPRGYIIVFVDSEGTVFANHDAFSKDIAFMAEAIQKEGTNPNSPLFGAVAKETGLMGHSMGGGAATVAASLTDVETLVTFAPAQLRFNTLTPASKVIADAIVFSGSSDGVTPPAEDHIPIYENLGSNCKYFINITGGAHCYYADPNGPCDFGESTSSNNIQITRQEQQAIMFKFLNSWFDYKLKGDQNAEELFLDDLEDEDGISFESNCIETISESNHIFTISPNPAQSTISIQSKSNTAIERIELYNSFGQLLSQHRDQNINVSELKSGYYLIKIKTNTSVQTERLVIQH